MDWDNYRAFLEVYRSGDLGHAAEALEMSVPTVRRRLDAVESHIGFPLFERTPRGLSPTPVARRLVCSISAMGDFASVGRMLREGPTRSVTIAANEALICYIDDAVWADLRQSHPDLQISVEALNVRSDIFDVRADVAISHQRPAAAPSAVRCAGSIEVGLFADADYLSSAGVPADLADLGRFAMIAPEADEARVWTDAHLGLRPDSMRCVLRTDSYSGQLAAIEAGVGIGVCPARLARRRPNLVRVLPEVGANVECWVWSPRSQLRGGATSLVIQSLMTALTDQIGPATRLRPLVAAAQPFGSIAA